MDKPVTMSKRAMLKNANRNPAIFPYAFEKGICVARIGSMLGGLNEISRIKKHTAKPKMNLSQFFACVFMVKKYY